MRTKKQPHTHPKLADLSPQDRAAIVCDVVEAMLDVYEITSDAMCNHDLNRAFGKRVGLPYLAVEMMAFDRVRPDDVREWMAFEASKAVAHG